MTQSLVSWLLIPILSVSLPAQEAPQAAPTGPASSSAPAQGSAPPPAIPTHVQPASVPPPADTLLDGTAVKLQISQNVSSADAHTGQEIPFEVMEDVNVSGVTVIKKGSTAIGIVTEAEPHKTMGRAGKLGIGISSVRLVDNEKVALRGEKDAKGGGRTGATTAAAAVTGAAAVLVLGTVFLPAAPALLLIHGKNTNIPQGTALVAFIDGDLHLNIAKFGAASPASTAAAAPEPTASGAFAPIAAPADPADPTQALLAIQDPGVYIKDASRAWVPIQPESVTFKAGGAIKNIASAHIMKGDLNGSLEGARSKLSIPLPVTFAVYMPEGGAISQYQLLRFHSVGDTRQFRSVNGGVLKKAGEATRDAIQFQAEKVSPRLCLITVERVLGKGEYGILPPAETNAQDSGANSGKETTAKIYTVSVTE